MRLISSRTVAIVAALILGPVAGIFAQNTPAENAAPQPDPVAAGSETPDVLLKKGAAAFRANDFVTAEEALEKFITEYGGEETREIVRLYTPVVAICKVGLKKFSEALQWIEKAFADPELDPAFADELAFWRGLCLMQQGDLVAAQ